MSRIPVKLLDLRLVSDDGNSVLINRMSTSWARAEEILSQWSAEAPSETLTCEFTVMFEDGHTFTNNISFGDGVKPDFAAFADNYVATAAPGSREALENFVEHYEFGSPPMSVNFGRFGF